MLSGDARREFMSDWDGTEKLPSGHDQKHRRQWFEDVKAYLHTRGRRRVELVEWPPSDLEYLCTLVGAITATGGTDYQFTSQTELLSDIGPYPTSRENTKEGFLMKATDSKRQTGEGFLEDFETWEAFKGWDIAVAVKIGFGVRDAPAGGSFALYCRHQDRDDEEERWRWRYGEHAESYSSKVYDNIAEYVEYWAHNNEQTEEEFMRRLEFD